MQIKILNIFILLPVFFLFLPAFAFYVPILNHAYLFFYVFLNMFVLILFIFRGREVLNKLVSVYTKTPLKYLIRTFMVMMLSSIIMSFTGITSFSRTFGYIFLYFILAILPVIIYFTYIIDNIISYKNFIKLFIVLFWINLNIGFIAYIGQWFDIEVINTIFDFFANMRILSNSYLNMESSMVASNYIAFGLPRLDNLFEEPGNYAQFLYIFLPLVYSIGNSKFKILKNQYINLFIKKTIIPFTLISIILTLSPIYLLLMLITTFLYYFESISKTIQKYFIQYLLCLFILTFIIIIIFNCLNINLTDTYLSRIINVLFNIKSFDDFILVEPSLATRVVGYINSLYLFIKYPILGVGIGNLSNADLMYPQYLVSPVSLTPEIIQKTNLMLQVKNYVFINKGFIYAFLAEFGLISFSFFIFFCINLYKKISLLTLKYKGTFEYTIARGLKYSILSLFIIFFYNLDFRANYFYLILVLSVLFIYNSIRKELYKDVTSCL